MQSMMIGQRFRAAGERGHPTIPLLSSCRPAVCIFRVCRSVFVSDMSGSFGRWEGALTARILVGPDGAP